MQDAFLCNTSTEGLTPLGTAPQRSFELITATLEARLTPAHVALFSEPVATQYGDRFDWYAPQGAKPRALETLPPEAQAEMQGRLASLLADISGEAATLSESNNPDDQRLGEALANATRYPQEGSVFVVDGPDGPQPVLVNWAWVAEGQAAVVGQLSGAGGRTRAARAAAAAATPSPAPVMAAAALAPPPPARRGPLGLWWLLWLGWALLALLIGIILYLMVAACALNLPGLPNYCPPPGPQASVVERQTLVLRDRIAAIERDISEADRLCQPVPLERAEAVPPPPPPVDDIDERLDQAGAQLGDLTFTLVWNSTDDLDLHVTCPTGGRVSYQRKQVCNGTLDVDSNAGNATPTPVENIFYNDPIAGSYTVRVHYYRSPRGWSNQPFQVRVTDSVRGTTQRFDGQVSQANRDWTMQYQTGGQ